MTTTSEKRSSSDNGEEKSRFVCKLCRLDYPTSVQFEEHLWSLLHHKAIHDSKPSAHHHCNLCLFESRDFNDYSKHLIGKRHKDAVVRRQKNLEVPLPDVNRKFGTSAHTPRPAQSSVQGEPEYLRFSEQPSRRPVNDARVQNCHQFQWEEDVNSSWSCNRNQYSCHSDRRNFPPQRDDFFREQQSSWRFGSQNYAPRGREQAMWNRHSWSESYPAQHRDQRWNSNNYATERCHGRFDFGAQENSSWHSDRSDQRCDLQAGDWNYQNRRDQNSQRWDQNPQRWHPAIHQGLQHQSMLAFRTQNQCRWSSQKPFGPPQRECSMNWEPINKSHSQNATSISNTCDKPMESSAFHVKAMNSQVSTVSKRTTIMQSVMFKKSEVGSESTQFASGVDKQRKKTEHFKGSIHPQHESKSAKSGPKRLNTQQRKQETVSLRKKCALLAQKQRSEAFAQNGTKSHMKSSTIFRTKVDKASCSSIRGVGTKKWKGMLSVKENKSKNEITLNQMKKMSSKKRSDVKTLMASNNACKASSTATSSAPVDKEKSSEAPHPADCSMVSSSTSSLDIASGPNAGAAARNVKSLVHVHKSGKKKKPAKTSWTGVNSNKKLLGVRNSGKKRKWVNISSAGVSNKKVPEVHKSSMKSKQTTMSSVGIATNKKRRLEACSAEFSQKKLCGDETANKSHDESQPDRSITTSSISVESTRPAENKLSHGTSGLHCSSTLPDTPADDEGINKPSDSNSQGCTHPQENMRNTIFENIAKSALTSHLSQEVDVVSPISPRLPPEISRNPVVNISETPVSSESRLGEGDNLTKPSLAQPSLCNVLASKQQKPGPRPNLSTARSRLRTDRDTHCPAEGQKLKKSMNVLLSDVARPTWQQKKLKMILKNAKKTPDRRQRFSNLLSPGHGESPESDMDIMDLDPGALEELLKSCDTDAADADILAQFTSTDDQLLNTLVGHRDNALTTMGISSPTRIARNMDLQERMYPDSTRRGLSSNHAEPTRPSSRPPLSLQGYGGVGTCCSMVTPQPRVKKEPLDDQEMNESGLLRGNGHERESKRIEMFLGAAYDNPTTSSRLIHGRGKLVEQVGHRIHRDSSDGSEGKLVDQVGNRVHRDSADGSEGKKASCANSQGSELDQAALGIGGNSTLSTSSSFKESIPSVHDTSIMKKKHKSKKSKAKKPKSRKRKDKHPYYPELRASEGSMGSLLEITIEENKLQVKMDRLSHRINKIVAAIQIKEAKVQGLKREKEEVISHLAQLRDQRLNLLLGLKASDKGKDDSTSIPMVSSSTSLADSTSLGCKQKRALGSADKTQDFPDGGIRISGATSADDPPEVCREVYRIALGGEEPSADCQSSHRELQVPQSMSRESLVRAVGELSRVGEVKVDILPVVSDFEPAGDQSGSEALPSGQDVVEALGHFLKVKSEPLDPVPEMDGETGISMQPLTDPSCIGIMDFSGEANRLPKAAARDCKEGKTPPVIEAMLPGIEQTYLRPMTSLPSCLHSNISLHSVPSTIKDNSGETIKQETDLSLGKREQQSRVGPPQKGFVINMQIINEKLYACISDGRFIVFNLGTNKIDAEEDLTLGEVRHVRMWSHPSTGRMLVFASDGSKNLVQFDLKGREFLHTVVLADSVTCLHVRWDSVYIGMARGDVAVFHIMKSKVLSYFEISPAFPVTAIASALEGGIHLLVVASADGSLTIRQARDGLLLRELAGHVDIVTQLQTSGSHLLSLAQDNSILIHDIETENIMKRIKHQTSVSCFTKVASTLVVAGCSGNIYYYNTEKNKAEVFETGCANITSLTASQDMVFLGMKDGFIDAIPLHPSTVYSCEWNRCVARFLQADVLGNHLKHTHVTHRTHQCLWRNCLKHFTDTTLEVVEAHVMSHVKELEKS